MYVKSLVSWLLAVATFIILKAHLGVPFELLDLACAVMSLIFLLYGSNAGNLSTAYSLLHLCVVVLNLTITGLLPVYATGSTLLLLMSALLAIVVCMSPIIVEALMVGFLAKDADGGGEGDRVVKRGSLIVAVLFSTLALLGLIFEAKQVFYLAVIFWVMVLGVIIANTMNTMGFAKR